MKPYKAVSPEITVSNIRGMLEKIGMFLREDTYSVSDNLFTTRISIANKGLDKLNIGTNGKGTSYQYALASGYAEFMERLQNGILFRGIKSAYKEEINHLAVSDSYKQKLIDNNIVLDFLYDPREKYSELDESINNNLEFYKNMYPFLLTKEEIKDFIHDILGFDSVIEVPFYSLKLNKEIYLPIEVLWFSCGSNGMASGNTKEEAIIQGFCEIFERYAGYEIYRKNLTPPDIPISEFRNEPVYKIIKSLIEQNDYHLIIKDCSLGLGLPVLGVLVIDEKNGRYNFNLGSALNPSIALERCLTELYQGSKTLSWYDIKFEEYSGNPQMSDEFIYINGSKLFVDSSGYWPQSLFAINPSYKYNGLIDGLNNSDEEDLKYIKNKIKALGFTAFIRDVSFMGFNSYYIIVPGMSQFPSSKQHYAVLGETISSLHVVRNLSETSIAETRKLCELVNKDYKYLKLINFNFNELMVYHNNSDLLDLDLELLLFMLNYKVGNINESYYYICEFLKDKEFIAYKYYFCIKDYVYFKMKGYLDNQISNQMGLLYGEIIEEVINDLKNPSQVLNGYEWPSCFRCNDCKIKNECSHLIFLSLYKKIQNMHRNNIIIHCENFI